MTRDRDTTVVPVFVHGLSSNAGRELWLNWTRPAGHPIDIVYGAPIDFADLLALPDEHDIHMRIVQRCMERIADLADRQRRLRDLRGGKVAIAPSPSGEGRS